MENNNAKVIRAISKCWTVAWEGETPVALMRYFTGPRDVENFTRSRMSSLLPRSVLMVRVSKPASSSAHSSCDGHADGAGTDQNGYFFCHSYSVFIIFAGTPATTAPSPMVTPGITLTREPSQASNETCYGWMVFRNAKVGIPHRL